MGDINSENINPNNAVIVGIITQKQTPELIKEYLDELEFLAKTYGVKNEKKIYAKTRDSQHSYFCRKRKTRRN